MSGNVFSRRRRITPEASVKSAIRALCKLRGWLLVPVPAGVTSLPGSPDYFLGARGKWIAIEVKRAVGARLSPAQLEFQGRCLAHGLTYLCVSDPQMLMDYVDGRNANAWNYRGGAG